MEQYAGFENFTHVILSNTNKRTKNRFMIQHPLILSRNYLGSIIKQGIKVKF